MRELTLDLFVTVDGWAKGTRSPAFFGYGGPELDAWIEEQAGAPHVVLMGASTYRALSELAADDRRMTEQPTVVFSRTLDGPLRWPGATLDRRDAAEAVTEMKAGPGDPLRVIGSLSLGRSLLRHGLVDRYRLVVFPLVLGATGAEPAFAWLPDLALEMRGCSVLDGRITVLEYAPGAARR